MEPLSKPPTTGTTLQWNLSPMHPLLRPLYSGTSLQSTHYWDHSTVEPLSNPPTTGTTLQWNLSLIHQLLGPLYGGTSLQSTHYWDHSTVEPLSNPPTTATTLQWNLFNNCNLNKIDNLVLMQLTPKSLDWCPARNPSTPGNSPPQCCWNRASTH